MPISPDKRVALVLAGAVAKGAFEAGALSVLAKRGACVRRIVAASSGALNGVCYAAGVRAGHPQEAAEKLLDLWRNEGGWSHVFHVDARAAIHLRGLSDHRKLLALLEEHVRPAGVSNVPIDLRLVVGALNGVVGTIGTERATTYEACIPFAAEDLDTAEGLAGVFRAALASASFPGAFAPFDLPGYGPCVDGGVVNNTPLAYAVEDIEDEIDVIVVVSPTVANFSDPTTEMGGLDLAGHLADMLINERLYRDLHEAEETNASLQRLEDLHLDEAVLAKVKVALRWEKRRRFEIRSIRPSAPLAGNSFSGFFDAKVRAADIESGVRAAEEALA